MKRGLVRWVSQTLWDALSYDDRRAWRDRSTKPRRHAGIRELYESRQSAVKNSEATDIS
jgi:hypothetical protein